MKILEYALFVVINRCFSGSDAVKSGLFFNAIENLWYSDRRAKCDALGIKTFKGLLHDIGMSFVQERVHTGCYMIPELNLFGTSCEFIGFSFHNETLILDDILYLYNVNAV